jgi:hypothetical protein
MERTSARHRKRCHDLAAPDVTKITAFAEGSGPNRGISARPQPGRPARRGRRQASLVGRSFDVKCPALTQKRPLVRLAGRRLPEGGKLKGAPVSVFESFLAIPAKPF